METFWSLRGLCGKIYYVISGFLQPAQRRENEKGDSDLFAKPQHTWILIEDAETPKLCVLSLGHNSWLLLQVAALVLTRLKK